jgi:hypothetical protein
MGIREKLNGKPWITVVTLLVGVTLAIWYLISSLSTGGGVGRQFYTDDDGKTWFADAAGKAVPYERGGKTVVMAEVFEVKGRQFVAYMRRHTAASLEAMKKQTATVKGSAINYRMEYKKPGDTKWRDIEGDVKAMAEYLNLSSPEGDLVQVEP